MGPQTMRRMPDPEASRAWSSSSLSWRRPAGDRLGAARVSSRSTPRRRRISVSAARAVSPIADSRCAPVGGIPAVVSRAVSACTAIMEMWCATTSCSSRKTRARSPGHVLGQHSDDLRQPRPGSLAAARRVAPAHAAARPSAPEHAQDPGRQRGQRAPPGTAAPGTAASSCNRCRPSRYNTTSSAIRPATVGVKGRKDTHTDRHRSRRRVSTQPERQHREQRTARRRSTDPAARPRYRSQDSDDAWPTAATAEAASRSARRVRASATAGSASAPQRAQSPAAATPPVSSLATAPATPTAGIPPSLAHGGQGPSLAAATANSSPA